MRFTVEKLQAVQKEIESLEESQRKMLLNDYMKIENDGIEFVKTKAIQKNIYEIKTNELRSLFKYK